MWDVNSIKQFTQLPFLFLFLEKFIILASFLQYDDYGKIYISFGWKESLYQWFFFQDESTSSSSSLGNMSSTKSCNSNLLTSGRAWAISLTLRSTISEEILQLCFPSDGDGMDGKLLYQFVILNIDLLLIKLFYYILCWVPAWHCWWSLDSLSTGGCSIWEIKFLLKILVDCCLRCYVFYHLASRFCQICSSVQLKLELIDTWNFLLVSSLRDFTIFIFCLL